MHGIADLGFQYCSPIQAQSLPYTLRGNDVVGKAQTGTGKTAAFLVTIIDDLLKHPIEHERFAGEARALIIAPTRELVMQIADDARGLAKYTDLNVHTLVGGMDYDKQRRHLDERLCDILVATPGRLIDFCSSKDVYLDRVEVLVIDEADRMLDMGFIHDIRKILALLPTRRQNLMFSATFSPDIRALAKGLVNDPVEVDVSPRNTTTELVTQWIAPVDKKRKPALLTHLIQEHNWYQVLVFSRTKHGANRLAKQLEGSGIEAAAIHGNKSQNARTRALADFKSGKIRALVATDIAARGLDIEQLPQVVNVDLPNVPEDYVHRIGRTGRAGATGQAISLVSADEFQQLTDIERLTQQQLERKIVAGFEPGEPLPAARPLQAPKRKRPKKPKKPGVAQDQRQSSSGNQGDQKAARPAGNRPPRGNKPGGGNGQQRRRRRPSGNRAQARTGS
ncbi:MAG TPA: ATP-dependent RNA helicase [Porticoccaceae bacterium]|nr:ATP-dependent RNA helicase [Porticoccaceae bacterium]